MTVGAELKQARERAGLSPEEISERTKIQLYKIDALEKGDFELLPQGIYLDGIVRAYAHEVALEPDRMVERVRLERGKLPGDWEVPFAAPIDLHPGSTPSDIRVVEVPDTDALNSFAPEEPVAASPAAPHVRHDPDELELTPTPAEPYVRPAPEAHPKYLLDELRASQWRHHAARARRRTRTGIAVPVLLLLVAASAGAYVYQTYGSFERFSTAYRSSFERFSTAYRSRFSAPPEQRAAEIAASTTPGAPGAPATRETDAAVEYSENAVTRSNSGPRPSDDAATMKPATPPGDTALGTSGRTSVAKDPPVQRRLRAAPRPEPAGRPSAPIRSPSAAQDLSAPAAPANRASAASATASVSRENPPVATTDRPAESAAKPPRASRVLTTAPTGPVPNVSGSWKLDTRVESSSLGRFAGLQLGYEMKLEQDGDRVTGVGRKITENGDGIGSRAQTPISVNGTVSGDRVTLTFTEAGLRRPSQGKFVLLLERDGTLRGRFSSDAARSSGRVEAHRVGGQ